MGTVIIAKSNEAQLCNQLIMFSAVYAFCLERGHRLWNPAFARYAHHFEQFRGPVRDGIGISPTDALAWDGRFGGALRGLSAKSARFLHRRTWLVRTFKSAREPGITRLPPTPAPDQAPVPELGRATWYFSGWRFRNPAGMGRHRDAIRRAFRPAAEHGAKIAEFAERLRERRAGTDRLAVGVHIRRRDYREWRGGEFFWPLERYASEMRGWARRYAAREPLFVVCADEPVDERAFGGLDVVLPRGHFMVDLHALAHCDVVLGPPSTFSAWAAWYGDERGRKRVYHMERKEGDGLEGPEEGMPILTRMEDVDEWVGSRTGAREAVSGV